MMKEFSQKNEDYEVVCVIPVTRGMWMEPTHQHSTKGWLGFYFEEFVIDWSLFPDCFGKWYCETLHSEEQGGQMRMSYQQKPHIMYAMVGSEIRTERKNSNRWQLLESGWFKLPEKPDVSCVWIQGKPDDGKKLSLALATLVIARRKKNE